MLGEVFNYGKQQKYYTSHKDVFVHFINAEAQSCRATILENAKNTDQKLLFVYSTISEK